MSVDEPELSPDEEARALLQWVIPKLPNAVGARLLADSAVIAKLGLPTTEFIRIWGSRFSKPELFGYLRKIANGRKASLSSDDGKTKVEEAWLDDDGDALLRVGTEVARFANVAFFSKDAKRRSRGMDVAFANGEMPADREATWRATVTAGPLDDALFLTLDAELGSNPETAYREMAAGISNGTATFNDLVPLGVGHYAALLNLQSPPPTLSEFRDGWLANAVKLDGRQLMRLLKLSGPISIVCGALLTQASDALSDEQRLDVVDFLQSCPDPFSIEAAFEIASRHRSNATMQSIADKLIVRLSDQSDPMFEEAGPVLAASVAVTTALTARVRTLAAFPMYAKRLAILVHANHLLRVFRDANVDPTLFSDEVARTFGPQARLADLCDAREAPIFQAHRMTPPFVHAVVLGRVTEAISQIEESSRPSEWLKAGETAIADASAEGLGIVLFAPGPFDEFLPEWKGLTELPSESVEDIRLALEEDADPQRGISDLFKISLAFEVPPDARFGLVDAIPKFLNSLHGAEFLLAAEFALQLASRWRDEQLSDRIVDLTLERARTEGLHDAGASPRLILLAAAAVEDRKLWLQRAGNVARSFAYVQRPGPPSINLMRAAELLRDFDPELGPELASAKAYALLTFDRPPSAPSAHEHSARRDYNEPNDCH